MLPDPLFGPVRLYGLCTALGVVLAFLLLYIYVRVKKVEYRFSDFLFLNGVTSVAVGFVAAAAFQGLYHYLEDPSRGFSMTGGITFLGGLIGGVAFFLLMYLLFRKRFETRLFQVLSALPCSILLGHAFGRVGCFFAGCCYGKATDSWLGVQFPHLPGPVHATQLYEAAVLFVLFGICTWLLFKKDFRHNMSIYLIGYGCARFGLEYLRDDPRGQLLGVFSPSQFWSLCMVALGIGLIFVTKRLWRNHEAVS